jgi:hypothetical protein
MTLCPRIKKIRCSICPKSALRQQKKHGAESIGHREIKMGRWGDRETKEFGNAE